MNETAPALASDVAPAAAPAFAQGEFILAAVFLLLCLMSLASWYVIFWKAWSLRKERKALEKLLRDHATSPDWARYESIRDIAPQGWVGRLIQTALKLRPVIALADTPQQREILSVHLTQALDGARVHLDRGLTVLASVGSSSPFIGLFGTVIGIYGALIKISTEVSPGLNVVAGPMGEALLATAMGLFAAIPAVLAYNSFARLNRLLVQDLRHVAEQMALHLPFAETEQVVESRAENLKLVREGR